MVTPFEINFYFGIVGLVITVVYNFVLTSNYVNFVDATGDELTGSTLMTLVAVTGMLGIV